MLSLEAFCQSEVITMVWIRVWGPSFQIGSFLQFRSPLKFRALGSRISASQYQCWESLNSLSTDNPSIWPSPFFIYFPNSPLLARLFRQYRPNEIQDKNKNKLIWESYVFIFRRLKNNIKCFFIINSFISNTRLRSEIMINIQDERQRKTYWVKNITATKSIHY